MVSVLVVDDESDIREAVSEVLADEGYVVHGAGDGAEALRKARAVRPQLVLLDLMMPGMNGWEFRAAQRGDPELRDIPVVVLSALGRVSGMDAADFIQKPFDLDRLLSAVRTHARANGHDSHAPM
jgi:CheY-like chemotaxis protein